MIGLARLSAPVSTAWEQLAQVLLELRKHTALLMPGFPLVLEAMTKHLGFISRSSCWAGEHLSEKRSRAQHTELPLLPDDDRVKDNQRGPRARANMPSTVGIGLAQSRQCPGTQNRCPDGLPGPDYSKTAVKASELVTYELVTAKSPKTPGNQQATLAQRASEENAGDMANAVSVSSPVGSV